ncbi:type I restriction-modification system subunit M N-terminal domain-containing protein [Bradyrhizobium zhanjiangense]|uniref:type I restriction-modification system subunit M N-terminal domain-containing protein n=1 Tax=Bradyrhizobium zhanjiangense TaxID=1325107 RepID=UPI001FE11EBB|nr:type I restriction-modification system subunit M N-terminal domain-containing protein [Bradyrhizobium zhanjiangense]
MNPATDLVNKLWRLCAMLRKDGVTYQQYVTELTYLLFLKMASEQKDESRIPEKYRWSALKSAPETEVLQRYRQALIDLGEAPRLPTARWSRFSRTPRPSCASRSICAG